MIDFLLFCLASVGMTLILVRGSLFASFREKLFEEADRIRNKRQKKGQANGFTLIEFVADMIHCVQCTGFWCGLFCGFFLLTSDSVWIGFSFMGPRLLFNRILMLFCCGLAGSFLASVGDILIEWMFFSKLRKERWILEDDHRKAEQNADRGFHQTSSETSDFLPENDDTGLANP